jgi:hypothetical protein
MLTAHLYLHEFISTVACDVYQYITVLVRQQPPGPCRARSMSVCQDSQNAVQGNFIVPIVYFRVVCVEIETPGGIIEELHTPVIPYTSGFTEALFLATARRLSQQALKHRQSHNTLDSKSITD